MWSTGVLLLGAAALMLAPPPTTASIFGTDYGLYTLVLNSALLTCEFNKTLGLDVSLLKLYKYDFVNDVNNTYYLNTSATDILADSTFDVNRTTLLYVGGYTEDIDSSNADHVLNNLRDWPDSYLYIVDHHNYTYRDGLKYLSSYKRSVRYYWDIGRAIAEFLVKLVAGGVSLERVHLIGHSLGGQIVGAAAETYYNLTGVLLPRVVGSDPAGPCFDKADKEFQLRSGLAEYVQVYHCNRNQLGTDNDYGDATFNVNNGEKQPGCRTLLIQDVVLDAKMAKCSHRYCPNIVTLSALEQQRTLWPAVQCDSYSSFTAGDCANNTAALAGLPEDAAANGTYYFDTDDYISED